MAGNKSLSMLNILPPRVTQAFHFQCTERGGVRVGETSVLQCYFILPPLVTHALHFQCAERGGVGATSLVVCRSSEE